MKHILLIVLVVTALSPHLSAQEIDTVPISVKDLDIKLRKNPMPSRLGILQFQPVTLTPALVEAKINYWRTGTNLGINLNQASFSDNWKGGGVNSVALGGTINYKAEYAKQSYSYISEVNLQYGKVKNKDQLQKKTNDRIFWDNKAAIQMSKNWYFFGSVSFESQFDRGYSYSKDAQGNELENLLSKFMAPGYLTESVGFEYRPSKYFSSRIGTGTARQTFVLDTTIYKTNPGNFGVANGKKFKNDLAFQLVNNFEKEVAKNILVKARYNIFFPYEDISFSNTDHRLDFNIMAKVNKLINVSLNGIAIYDKDQLKPGDQKIQFSQSLALGFGFSFPR